MTARVWQIASGPWGRSFSAVFLRHGVGLIGPGDAGPWTPARPDTDFDGTSVRRFATPALLRGIVLLRAGHSVGKAAGLFATDYHYPAPLDYVDSWGLQPHP